MVQSVNPKPGKAKTHLIINRTRDPHAQSRFTNYGRGRCKFSSMVIGKTLKRQDTGTFVSPTTPIPPIAMLEERASSVLVADWLMPEMDGLEMAARIRQIDEQTNHFTHIILPRPPKGWKPFLKAFDRGVDDFIYKSDMNKQLLPRIYAADRISDMQNSMLMANQLLLENNHLLEQNSVVDSPDRARNQRYAIERLTAALKHTDSRGWRNQLSADRHQELADA